MNRQNYKTFYLSIRKLVLHLPLPALRFWVPLLRLFFLPLPLTFLSWFALFFPFSVWFLLLSCEWFEPFYLFTFECIVEFRSKGLLMPIGSCWKFRFCGFRSILVTQEFARKAKVCKLRTVRFTKAAWRILAIIRFCWCCTWDFLGIVWIEFCLSVSFERKLPVSWTSWIANFFFKIPPWFWVPSLTTFELQTTWRVFSFHIRFFPFTFPQAIALHTVPFLRFQLLYSARPR